jgi:hypothetical protein
MSNLGLVSIYCKPAGDRYLDGSEGGVRIGYCRFSMESEVDRRNDYDQRND